VNAFLDTSVLVATFYGDHEHHEPSLRVFLQQTKATGSTAAHCLAETYAVVTAMPGTNRASPDEALLFLRDVCERLTLVTLVTLDEAEYFEALEAVVANRVTGGTTYDALIARCALKVGARTLYTWNRRHFDRLGADVAARLKQP
jgi:predicted nucleic acid-binding protein